MSLRAHWLAATLSVILSVAAGLAVCEVVLRLAHPRYAHIAGVRPPQPAPAAPAPAEGRSPLPRHNWSWQGTWRRPDTHEQHRLSYNRFGGRQHRDFSDRDLREGVNLAFFGDSFTENRGIAAPYSFTEVLDYLLNARAGDARSGAAVPERINVLNFGFNATGPGRQHARYLAFPHKALLRHVFYVHVANDFDDLRRTGLWAVDAHGNLLGGRQPPDTIETAPPPVILQRLSRLHLTYLALHAWQRLTGTNTSEAGSNPAFRAGLSRWRAQVEANGGAFHVVLVPVPGTARRFAKAGVPASVDVLDLSACFREVIDAYAWADQRFEQDWHWDEAGNMVAAHCLYRFVEGKLGLGRASDVALAQARHVYYRAFADDAGWSGRRFMPAAPWALPQPHGGGGGGSSACDSRPLSRRHRGPSAAHHAGTSPNAAGGAGRWLGGVRRPGSQSAYVGEVAVRGGSRARATLVSTPTRVRHEERCRNVRRP